MQAVEPASIFDDDFYNLNVEKSPLWCRRQLLILVLVLHTVHAPIPLPDLDGECRGTPIHSLIEGHAWHPILLGVRPNDDVDRGPIRTDRSGNTFDLAPFGEFANIQDEPEPVQPAVGLPAITGVGIRVTSLSANHNVRATRPGQIKDSRSASVHFCRWQI